MTDIAGDAFTTDEDIAISGNLASNDSFEGSTAAYSLETSPDHGTATISTDGTFTYTPDADYNGTDTFTYKVVSGGAAECDCNSNA